MILVLTTDLFRHNRIEGEFCKVVTSYPISKCSLVKFTDGKQLIVNDKHLRPKQEEDRDTRSLIHNEDDKAPE